MSDIELRFSEKNQSLVRLSREDVRNLPRKVKLLVTKTRSAEQLQSNEKAEAVWMRYIRLNKYEQYIGRPMYVKQLKALEIDDVDSLLPIVTKEQADQFLEQQAQQQPKPPSKSISAKLTDLAPSERAQVLQSEGIQPATDAELMQKQAIDTAAKVAEKTPHAPYPQPAGGS